MVEWGIFDTLMFKFFCLIMILYFLASDVIVDSL